MLSTDTNAPPVTKTTVSTNFLHPLDIITKFGIKVLRKHLGVLARLKILLSVQEPKWDFELTGFWMTATSFSISSAVSSPARLFTLISAFLQMRSAKRRPRPLIFVRPKTTFLLPSTLVLRIRKMCWNSFPCIIDILLQDCVRTR